MRMLSRMVCGIVLIAAGLFIGCEAGVHSDEPVCAVPAPEFVPVENHGLDAVFVDGVFLQPGARITVDIAPNVVVCEPPSFEADLNDFIIGLGPNMEVVGGVIIIL